MNTTPQFCAGTTHLGGMESFSITISRKPMEFLINEVCQIDLETIFIFNFCGGKPLSAL